MIVYKHQKYPTAEIVKFERAKWFVKTFYISVKGLYTLSKGHTVQAAANRTLAVFGTDFAACAGIVNRFGYGFKERKNTDC